MTTKATCEDCDGDLEMYYGWWCPRCDKPAFYNVRCLNFIKALRHIEMIENLPGYKNRMWEFFFTYIHNDTYFEWSFVDLDEDEYEEHELEDLKTFMEVFGLNEGDSVLFHVSW